MVFVQLSGGGGGAREVVMEGGKEFSVCCLGTFAENVVSHNMMYKPKHSVSKSKDSIH